MYRARSVRRLRSRRVGVGCGRARGLDLNCFSTLLGVRVAAAEGLVYAVGWQGGEPPSLPSVYGGKVLFLSKFLLDSHNPVPSIPPFFSFV